MTSNLAFNKSGQGLQHLDDQATVSNFQVMGKTYESNVVNVLETIAHESNNGRVEGTDLLKAANAEAVQVVQSPGFVTQRADATVDYKYDPEINENIGTLNFNSGPA